jgi:hypothetical protein
MDLTSDQHKRITAFIQDWSKDKTMELETTFGERGVVDSTTFLQIAKRLRAKNYEMIPQDDRLSILTPNQLRISLQGLGVIQSYCKDDTLHNKTYTVMAKSRTSPDSNIDLRDYNVRFKVRRESDLSHDDPLVTPIISNWATHRKAFRLIRRWSFRGKGIRFDLSMIRQSPTTSTGEFQWATRFLQYNILSQPARYEVEVELLHDEEDTATPELAYASLIRGVGEILRAIQKNSLLIRVSVANKVRAEYEQVIGTSRFRGVGPVTLEIKNMKKEIEDDIPNVRSGYNVTDKADGLRAMGFVDQTGELFLLDQSMNVYRTGLRNPACAHSLIDGEWVTLTDDGKPINHYLLFDIYNAKEGKSTWDLPFVAIKDGAIDPAAPSRYQKLKEWYQAWSTGVETTSKAILPNNRLMIALKRFEFAAADSDIIFRRCCSAILDASRIYHTDGLILTSNSQPLPSKAGGRFTHQFKWKPAKDNTVDFLIKYERHSELPMDKITTITSAANEIIQFKTMHLYVGGMARANPRDMILNQLDLSKDAASGYQAVLFTPLDFSDTMANTCYVTVKQDAETLEFYSRTEDSEEPITDNSVVEMRYDPTREPGWRWVPSRIRHDKTERLLRATELAKSTRKSITYSGVMNDEAVANSVWNSIHEPITVSMIRNGNEQPAEDELKAMIGFREAEITKTYYLRSAPKESIALVSGLQDFHNKYIKNELLLKTALRTGKNILDVACGKGGDLWKWINGGARNVIGIDYAGENITNPKDGAYRRYLEAKQKVHQRVPNIAFVIGNSSKRIVTGEAGANPQERDILRSVFGKENPQGAVPSYIEKVMAGTFIGGADVTACMFALHYFFESESTLSGFLQNLSDTVKPNGLFIGCCFDGNRVFQLLRGTPLHESIVRTENDVNIWSITKEYEQHEFLADETSVGMAIDVEFISIGSKYREYLVSFDYLVSRLEKIGFRLLNEKELAELNLKHSTNTFDVSHSMAAAQKMNFTMMDSVKEFSFLNRWFIFKRMDVSAAVTVPPELVEHKIELADEMEDEEVEEVEEVKEEQVVADGFRLPPRDKMWEPQQIFSFGTDAVRKDILRLLDAKGKPDVTLGRWMSLAAPFPIPDPMPNLDDPSAEAIPEHAIMYPSIEHYLAGMKLKHALVTPRRAGEPDLGQLLMSKDGDIHQEAEKERREAMRRKPFLPESDDDYKLLTKEAQKVRKFFTTKKTLNQYKAQISDDKWLPIRDKYLHDALLYRFKYDERFHKGVIAAKDEKKYLLHTKTSTNTNIDETGESVEGTASELYGKRDPNRKIILGKNKVGTMLMEIAGYQF